MSDRFEPGILDFGISWLEQAFEGAKDAPVGSTLRIRLPQDYSLGPPPGHWAAISGVGGLLTRYNFLTDQLVPVDQQWVDDVGQSLKESAEREMLLERELAETKAKLAAHELADAARMQGYPPKSEQDRIWRTVQLAAKA